jgi:hypothetical protein
MLLLKNTAFLVMVMPCFWKRNYFNKKPPAECSEKTA